MKDSQTELSWAGGMAGWLFILILVHNENQTTQKLIVDQLSVLELYCVGLGVTKEYVRVTNELMKFYRLMKSHSK